MILPQNFQKMLVSLKLRYNELFKMIGALWAPKTKILPMKIVKKIPKKTYFKCNALISL